MDEIVIIGRAMPSNSESMAYNFDKYRSVTKPVTSEEVLEAIDRKARLKEKTKKMMVEYKNTVKNKML